MRAGITSFARPSRLALGDEGADAFFSVARQHVLDHHLSRIGVRLGERKLQLAAMSKLPEMRRELKQLAARLAALEGGGGREAAEAA